MESPASGANLADFQMVASRPLGNGSAAVCDDGPAPDEPIGGVPAVDPPDFGSSQTSIDAINDLACRFDTHLTTTTACTKNALGNFSFVRPDTLIQYCTAPALGAELALPSGDTTLTLQIRDTSGNIGNQAQIIVRVP
jgi:hypothetical protein